MKHAALFMLGILCTLPFRFERPAQAQTQAPEVKPFTIEVRRDCYFEDEGQDKRMARMSMEDIKEIIQ